MHFSSIGPYQVLSLWVRVGLEMMAMKGCSGFPKAPALLEPHRQIVWCHIQDTHWAGVLPLCRDIVGVFYIPSWLGKNMAILTCVLRILRSADDLLECSSCSIFNSIAEGKKKKLKKLLIYMYKQGHLVLIKYVNTKNTRVNQKCCNILVCF